ncbi:MAG: hypothetical protein V2I46_10085 [Bacteroides sp.]|nr:hypothetical protein [Bacteroides sp.]
MILYSKQNIHKWAWWKNKPIFLFCITSGLLFALGVTILSLLIKLCGNPDINIWRNTWPVLAGSFVSGSLFSIILWYQNDDRYREWLKKKEKPS